MPNRFAPRVLRNLISAVVCAVLTLGAFAPAKAEVKVGVSDWPGWVAWYVAEQKGYFAAHGAKVKLVWFANYTDSISALSSGQLDGNSQTWSDTMTPLARKVKVKTILVNDNSAGNDALMVSPKIRSFADLKGKSVALEQYSISHFVLANALSRNGMSIRDVKIVNLSAGDAAAAFMSGRADAAVVWNPWVSRIESSGKGRALFTSKDMPGLVPDLLVAHEKALGDKAKRAELVGMIKAWFDTEEFIRSHPDEALKIMSKVVSLKPAEYQVFMPGTRFFNAADNLAAMDAANPKSLVAVGPTIHQFLSSNKLVDGAVDFSSGIDKSLLLDAQKK
ncbi:NitT/TauT family transport system substrate-binding protein [Duganella sp. CF402]|uniref:ABC transporter substrate-binding protein n=1 Tax=unclassified Duganella TaxID=2636909 RepID=UPI0008BC2FD5|nr:MULTISPECIES: ABC transporter substrate-binding protein [unclassified Duganella]RZT10648.1 NitT/TauT family transport system substrate-binding protein [Duganella sp. BK701]SEL04146.1 NitT/TauT family transport system substrate-binding protein [Duganella sp. CF402]